MYPWAQEKGEAVIHGQARRFTHTVGESPFMAVEVFKTAGTLPSKLRRKFNEKARKLGWSVR